MCPGRRLGPLAPAATTEDPEAPKQDTLLPSPENRIPGAPTEARCPLGPLERVTPQRSVHRELLWQNLGLNQPFPGIEVCLLGREDTWQPSGALSSGAGSSAGPGPPAPIHHQVPLALSPEDFACCLLRSFWPALWALPLTSVA